MSSMNIAKYKPYPVIDLPDRQWPSRVVTQSPQWCSVDLRDGNQALSVPMSIDEKVEMFDLLVEVGFKEIEVGFPSAAEVEFDFLRKLIDENRIPDDVTVQVLTQAREHLIRRSFEALEGAKNAIVHLYNSTSTLQRRVVFKMEREGVCAIARQGAQWMQDLKDEYENPGIRFQYSPESFTGTELDFSLECCHAVMDVWQPTPENKIILNLPATVEMSTPNIHADQIEWMCNNIRDRKSVIISLHTHNDRGTGTAASELGLLAGADRVEGTLFGNGERTGNLDITTMALNMFSQGIDTGLGFSDINRVSRIYQRCTRMGIHERHPYVGELVYTAFSGSHQDAINKGMGCHKASEAGIWEVPYLPIDPEDVGRSYESIIRINSQSGKGGVAYIMEQEFGYKLPKAMHPDFGRVIQKVTEKQGEELPPEAIRESFVNEYLTPVMMTYELKRCQIQTDAQADGEKPVTHVKADIVISGQLTSINGEGNGPIDAFSVGLKAVTDCQYTIKSYDEHAIGKGSDAQAVAYISLEFDDDKVLFGAGADENTSLASIKALLSALNRR